MIWSLEEFCSCSVALKLQSDNQSQEQEWNGIEHYLNGLLLKTLNYSSPGIASRNSKWGRKYTCFLTRLNPFSPNNYRFQLTHVKFTGWAAMRDGFIFKPLREQQNKIKREEEAKEIFPYTFLIALFCPSYTVVVNHQKCLLHIIANEASSLFKKIGKKGGSLRSQCTKMRLFQWFSNTVNPLVKISF